MPASSGKRLTWLDELRGIACLSVFVHHAAYAFEPALKAYPTLHQIWFNEVMGHFDFGVFGVFIFFLISGIVIPASVERTHPSTSAFILHRVLRIYPLYLASIALATLTYSLPIANALANVAMFPKLFGQGEAIGVYWSLQVEIIFYVLIALGIAVRWPRPTVIAAALFTGTWLITLALSFLRYSRPNLPVSPALSLLCIAAGFLYYRLTKPGTSQGYQAGLGMMVLAIIVAGTGAYSRSSRYQDAPAYALSILMAFMVIHFYPRFGRLQPALIKKGWQFLGTISFSVYLLHQLVLHAGTTQGWWQLPTGCAIVTAVSLTVLASYLTYRVFEQPFISLSKRPHDKLPVISAHD